MQVLETCSKPTALYMKLACDTALRWKSFSKNTHKELRPTATELIIELFERYVNPATLLFHYKEVEPLPLLLQNSFFQGEKKTTFLYVRTLTLAPTNKYTYLPQTVDFLS